MMHEILNLTLSLSLSGSVLILLLLLLRPLLRHRLSKRWQYYIWLLVIARLLLPLAPPDSPAGRVVLDVDEAVSAAGYSADYSAANTNPEFDAVDAGVERPEPSAWETFAYDAWQNAWVVWLGGALVMLIRKITAYQSFVRFVRTGWMAVDDHVLLDRAAEIGAEIGVKRPVELFVNPLAASPMLLGGRKPCVVLPEVCSEGQDLRCVLLHELAHYRRRDILYKWLAQITVCVHWFNPLVYWMAREIERLCELSCDEAVLKVLDEDSRRTYGDALLRTISASGGYKAAPPSSALGENGKLLKERLDTIMNFKKTSKLAAVLGVLLACALSVTALAAGAYTGVKMPGADDTLYGSYWDHAASAESRRTTETFYQEPYMFTITWNCRMQDGRSVQVTLPNGGKMSVWLANSALLTWLDKNPDAREALSEVIGKLWEDTKGTEFPLTSPLLIYYQDYGETSIPDLAEECYESYDLSAFKTVFAMLDKPDQAAWLSKIYEDEDIAFFSVAADGLTADGDLVKSFAEKMYADRAFSYFSVLMNRMSEETLEIWLDRAEEDESAGFLSMISQRLGETEELDKLKEELDRKQDKEYQSVGVTRDGGTYYYQGKKLYIFLDYQPDNGFYTMAMNPKAKDQKSVKIIRDANGKITGTAYLTEAEIAELFGDKKDKDDDWDWNWDWDDKQDDTALIEAYKTAGVTKEGKNYYYKGKLVNIFLDHRPDSSFYTLDMNPNGTVNVKILRNADNKITGAAYLTEDEVQELFGADEDMKYEVSKEIDSIRSGEYIWLGTFSMEKGDKVCYDAWAETGDALSIGFAKPGVKKPKTTYMTVTNRRTDGDLEICTHDMAWEVDSGEYNLFVYAKNGDLGSVSVEVAVTEG